MFNSLVIKYLGERVAKGFGRIIFIIDTSVIENDINWVAFACAIAASDIDYIRSKLSLADLRGLLSIYTEKIDTSNMREDEIA